MDDLVLLIVGVLFIIVALPIWALFKVSRLNKRLQDLTGKLLQLDDEIVSLKLATQPPAKSVRSKAKKQSPQPVKKSAVIDETAKPLAGKKVKTPVSPAPDMPQATITAKTKAKTKTKAKEQKSGLEENIASKWFVWVGAAAIALAGIFLVKYIAEQGIITPTVRMIMAFAIGTALAFGGEWVRRRPIQQMIASIKPSYVPMALTASGILVMYVAVYASYGLYNLISPLFAFILLAIVSFLAFALSILQGAPVAILGLLGGFITPALVSTGHPTSIGLFGYLATVTIACVAVMRYRPWWWLGFAVAAGSALWVVIWVVTEAVWGDVMIIGPFLTLVVVALSLLVGTDDKQKPFLHYLQAFGDLPGYKIVAMVASIVTALVFVLPFVFEHFSDRSLIFLAVLAGIIIALADVRPRLETHILVGLVLVLVSFGLWGLASRSIGLGYDFGLDIDKIWLTAVSPQVYRFLWWVTGFSIVMAVGGFIIATIRKNPLYWLALSIIAPLGLLIIAYLTFHASFPDRNWSFAALLLAGTALLACVLSHRRAPSPQATLSLGLYATAVIAGISLTMVFLLKDAWLTVALALQLPAIAWISNQLKLDILRKIAMVIAAAIFVRLALNPFMAGYAIDHYLGQHWVLYGYGIPALATHFACLWFARHKDDHLVMMLEGLRVIFAVLLISAEIRIFATGDLIQPYFNLTESALQSIAWLAVAWSRLRAFASTGRIVDQWSGYILFALGIAATFGVSLLINNPALTGENVGKWPVFNILLLAYVFPAVLIWFISRLPLEVFTAKRQMIIGGGVLALLFTYITLETRHMFQGPSLSFMPASDAETYAYSVVWLVFAFALLLFGLVKQRAVSRYAALLVLVITVLKVFLSDMNDLSGLWRVASFLGLGLSLVGIGYLYQRFLYLPAQMATKPVAKDG